MEPVYSTGSKADRKINESGRSGLPAVDLAFILHGVFTRRHYPNALAKWDRHGLEKLARLLQEESAGVSQALKALDERTEIEKLYRPVERSLLDRARTDPLSLFDASLVKALRTRKPGAVLRILDEPIDYVYRVRLLPPDVCSALLGEAARFVQWSDDVAARKGLHSSRRKTLGLGKGSAVLDTMGLAPFLDALMEHIVRPLAGLLFPGVGGGYLDYRHGYIASYSHKGGEMSYDSAMLGKVASTESKAAEEADAPAEAAGGGGAVPMEAAEQTEAVREVFDASGKSPATGAASSTGVAVADALLKKAGSRKGLVSHTDDSEVTVNCCLGLEFEGGEVEFRGLRSTKEEGELEEAIEAVPGIAMIHMGQHLHRVTDVTAGQRHALIVWCRSSDYRGANCPCCVLHRRSRCVCDATWN